jgi:hypothetical protein
MAVSVPGTRGKLALVCAVVAALLSGGLARGEARADAGPPAAGVPVTVTDYTDPDQMIAWGERSHWKQPWRSYLDTVPASTLLDAIGINFNVPARIAAPTARLLARSGFSRARVEVGWSTLEYDDPSRMNDQDRASLRAVLGALREHGIRPLILLNANHGMPCPVRRETIELTRPAATGATTVPRLRLRRPGALLKGRPAALFAHCDSPCRVRLRGLLRVGRRSFSIRARRQIVAAGPTSGAAVRFSLTIGPGAARLARRGLARGAKVRVVMAARAGDGGSNLLRRALVPHGLAPAP